MKVYTHYLNKIGIEYRWRTLLQIGDSWKVCGTIFMKNPGSSKNIKESLSPINDEGILNNLKEFDDIKTSPSYEWYEFSVDNTMACVKELFEAYYHEQKEPLNGVIQIFNLFNIRDAKLENAMEKSYGDIIDELAYTTDNDIKHLVPPVYIGWGDLWKHTTLCNNAEKIFSAVYDKTPYLCDDIQNNKFYHPQYLLYYGRNRKDCIIELNRFIQGNYYPKGLDNIDKLICLKKRIKAVGAISKIAKGATLTYEYFCKGTDGFKRQYGTISIGIEYNNEQGYVLSILSKGNHPEQLSVLVNDFFNKNGLFGLDNNKGANYIADSTNNMEAVAKVIEGLLIEIKSYREEVF